MANTRIKENWIYNPKQFWQRKWQIKIASHMKIHVRKVSSCVHIIS